MAANGNGDDGPPAGGGDLPTSGCDANKHLNKFFHVTQSIKVNGVSDDALRLYLLPYFLTHHATAWFDHLPRNLIIMFEQMAKMFLEKYFPPFMVTKLRNEITKFRQRPDESLFEAWECYKFSIDRCPNHNMLPVTQIDTFYNRLTLRHHDTTNTAAGGTFKKRRPEECYDLIENITAHHNDWDTSAQRSESSSSITSSFDSKIVALKAEMTEINKNLMKVLQINQQVKAVTHSCETCGGLHANNDCPAIVGQTQNVYATGAYNQGGSSYQPQGASHVQNPPPAYQEPAYQAPSYQALVQQALIPQPQVMTTTEFTNYMKENDAILKNMQTNMTSLTNSNLDLKNMFGQFMKMNAASSSSSGTLPSNTITNLKKDLKGITTRSGIAYKGVTIPTTSSPPKVVERETKVTKDTVHPTNNESTKYVQPSVVQVETQVPNSEPVVAPVVELVEAPKKLSLPKLSPTCMTLELANRSISHPVGVAKDVFVKVRKFHFPVDYVVFDFDADPRVPLILERSFLKTGRALIDVYEGESTLRGGNKSVTFNLDQTTRYSSNYDTESINQIDVIDVASEEYSQEVLGFFVSGNPTPYTKPIFSTSSPTLTPFEDSDFLLEETNRGRHSSF
uniref:Reverse transcriptase domain-containing protein n=1 Tax=Tanacetum cinerariifolium TaxID=118510 RepID=A0A699GU36_TANCI|nr:reverse transcriptase domain-containing protein [Tanacetum cinerariifolium]